MFSLSLSYFLANRISLYGTWTKRRRKQHEFQMTGMNSKLDASIETVFLMAADKWQFVSSSFVKEIASMGGDISQFVTPSVLSQLDDKFSNKQHE